MFQNIWIFFKKWLDDVYVIPLTILTNFSDFYYSFFSTRLVSLFCLLQPFTPDC